MSTTTLRELTREIAAKDRHLAPGSETTLWGEYLERMRQLTGILPICHYPGDGPSIPSEEADWWRGAYAAALCVWTHGMVEEPAIAYPPDPCLDGLSDPAAAADGWRYYIGEL